MLKEIFSGYLLTIATLLLTTKEGLFVLFPLSIFLFFAYKKDFLAPTINVLFTILFIPLGPILPIVCMSISWAALNAFVMFKVSDFIYGIVRLNPEKIRWLFSKDALTFAGLGSAFSFLFKSWIPAFLVTGPIVGAQLFLLAIEAGDRLYKMFTQYKLSNLAEPTPVISVNRPPNPTPSMPVLSPRHTSRSVFPSSLSPLIPKDDLLSNRVDPMFIDFLNVTKKVRELLKDTKNDYLLTENNNFFLRDAAEKNNWELVACLLKKPNVAAQAHYGDWLVLRLAIQHHQWKIVSKFLTLPIISQTPMSVGKNDVFNRLVHQVTVQKQSNIITEIIHSQIYDLFNSKTKLNFLLFSIEDNLYPNIIKILNDHELLDCLEPDDFNSIFENISKDILQKISTQCDFFLAYIKEKYINAPIAINHISIDHLINIDCFDSLESVALFYKDPYVFLRTKTNNKLHAISAMELLDYKNTYFKLRDSSREAKESAQQASEVIAANQLFQTVKSHYQETFDSKKTIEYSSVEAIEREIKTYLLEQILSEAQECVKKLQDLTPSTKIINIIDSQKEALLNGDVEAHIALIKVLNKHFVPHNVSAAQTAWLSYSAIHDIDVNGWKFLVQPTEEKVVHSTAESTQTDEAMTNIMASSIIRERVAYYWLAVTDETYPDLDDFRLGNFVGAISTIYKTYGFGGSCCYPGHLTAIAQMGLHHPIAEPITLENLLDQVVISHIIETAKDMLSDHPEWSAEDKENFLTSITYINEKNAEELFHTEEAPPIDMTICDKFNELVMYFSNEVIDEMMNHQRYKNRTISKDERELIKAGVQYKLANMASNQYILSALNKVILASRCIKKDINLEEASPYVPNTPKHKLYLELAKELNAKLLSLPDEELPCIVDLNKIGGEISKKIIDDIVSDKNPTDALNELKNYGLTINIDKIKHCHLMHGVDLSVLPQFNNQKINARNESKSSTHTSNKTTVTKKAMNK